MQKEKIILRVTFVGLIVNLLLSIVKYILGVVGHSQALVADAIHSLSDIISDVAIMIGVKFWSVPADEDHPHGHEKIEIIVSLFIGFLLFLVGAKLVYNAIIDIQSGTSQIPSMITLIAATLSIVLKEILYRWTVLRGTQVKSKSLIANGHHHRSDAISSIPVFVSILIASLFPNLSFVDNIGAIIVAIFIFQTSKKIISEAVDTLIDKSVSDDVIQEIEKVALSFKEIHAVHSIKTRYLGSSAIDVELCIEVDPLMTVTDADVVSHQFEDALKDCNNDIVDIAVHVDPHIC